jgi:hypothetical protein
LEKEKAALFNPIRLTSEACNHALSSAHLHGRFFSLACIAFDDTAASRHQEFIVMKTGHLNPFIRKMS